MSVDSQPTDFSSLPDFDYTLRTRVVFGVNSVDRAGELMRELGGRHTLLVTDAGLVAAGHPERVVQALEGANIKVTTFDHSEENPTTRCVNDCTAVARQAGIDSIIGLGGGSSMDTAKGCNFLVTNGGRIQDYWGIGKATQPMLPMIAIPTTAGTGSECQSFALIADETTHLKMACGDPKAAARIAILDPGLTISQPPAVTAHAGVDAIAHAVETAVTTKRNPLSLMYSHQAFKLGLPSLPIVLRHPKDIIARGRMLLSASFAGIAIENSMLGAAHAAANPLTAHYGVVHGEAVGLMLPAVMRFNAQDPEVAAAYADLAYAADIAWIDHGAAAAVDALIARLEDLLNLAQIARSLEAVGARRADIGVLAAEAAQQWTARFNPRPIAAADFAHLYETAFKER